MTTQSELQEPGRTTEIEVRSRAFIDALNKKGFPPHDFRYKELGPVDKNSPLQNVEITATKLGWQLYTSFVYTISTAAASNRN